MSNIIILVNLFIVIIGLVSADLTCGDWTSYQDEKCLKVFDTLTPFSGAAQVCQKKGGYIGMIRSAEEQGQVVANLKAQSIVDDIWIGIKKNGKSFVSLDGKALKYTNWANGKPDNVTDFDCVELSEDEQDKWVNIKCEKKNAVLCEKPQQWTLSKIENILEQIRKNHSERIELLEANLQTRGKEIDQLKQNQNNPVPIGFIYAQLSGQSEPHTLWPQTEWNNISQNYSGLFFRAEGSGSASFGQIQNEQTQSFQLTRVTCALDVSDCDDVGRKSHNPYTITNNFNAPITTGKAERPVFGMAFRYTTNEIRPRNQAIRIWIRIK